MSTVIPNGYVTDETNFFKITEALEALKDQLEERCYNMIYKDLSETFAESFSSHFFGEAKPDEKSPFATVSQRLREIPEETFAVRVILYPLENKTLVTFHSPFGEIESDAIMTTDSIFRSYHYWNNVDGDKDISEDEWKQRGIDWKVLGAGPDSDYGFSYLLFTPTNAKVLPYLPDFKDNLFKQFESLEKFKYSLAYQRALNQFCNTTDTTKFFKLFNEFRTLIETDDTLVQNNLKLMDHLTNWDDIADNSRTKV